jgi:putative flippase GtrA
MQLSKFSFVGILNTIVGYGAFFIFLTWFNYLVSLIIAHIIGVTHSYVWNKYWTFKTDKIQIKEFVKFNSVYVIVFVVNAITLDLLQNNILRKKEVLLFRSSLPVQQHFK